ncbi:Glycosyltransferase involved in cell wall bisynthesis [Chryseobacterium taichungense]|uniref:Glycosyltransferase involved in cell wall bisynthesis n=1 Tax=Chryseobacterium taichungense TaxID=295069 RepID=A0A1H7ZJB3_9FLAO|nr:glycosyltransferase [Chryseobacterium taichungense]SEM57579.1 Glycosyltransferase involved in cell wall bisynthesis [Chryseobacterium taichungense]
MIKKDKIKVLFRHRSMEMGGVEKVVLSMLNNLNREKFELTICLNINQGELRNEFPSHVRKVYIAKGKEDFSKNPLIRKLQLAIRKLKLNKAQKDPSVADRILQDQFDVEIATTYAVYETVLNSSNKNSKKVAWLHSDLTLPSFDPYRENIFNSMKQFDYIIYGSQQCKDILEEKYPDVHFPPGKVILNAIPMEEIKEKALAFIPEFENVPIFVSVGRLDIRKGYRTLLETHQKLLADGYTHHIYVIGNGEDYEMLSKRIDELGVKNSFKLLGTQINPYPYVKNADFYIMPSESEGWPLIIAETLILQKPIIATAVGGVPEMIDHKITGYLTEYSQEGLYFGIKEFLTNKNLVENIQKNLVNIEGKFDNKKIFGAVEEIIQELTGRHE